MTARTMNALTNARARARAARADAAHPPFRGKVRELYSATKIRGFLHLYIGEEAVAVGVMRVPRAEDAVVATYREHGHALARGVSMNAIMAEMYGKQEGCSRGRGGSMHIFDARRASTAATRSSAAACRSRSALRWPTSSPAGAAVTACFFGEGAAAEGEFHESLNLAALWKLPVLFLCENNRYAMGTALERSESQTTHRPQGRELPTCRATVDGMDVIAVEAATRRGGRRDPPGGGPQFLEFATYRFRAIRCSTGALSQQGGGRAAGRSAARSSRSSRLKAARPDWMTPASRRSKQGRRRDRRCRRIRREPARSSRSKR
jgi:pyruvate dehydrogenase E1 component alpha subunit